MVETIFLAQVIGVYLLVMGLSVLIHPARVMSAMSSLSKEKGLAYFGGAVALIIGLLLVLTHNEWTDLSTSLVSLIGWIALVKGVIYLLAPEAMNNIITGFKKDTTLRILGLVILVVGGYLAYVGFLV